MSWMRNSARREIPAKHGRKHGARFRRSADWFWGLGMASPVLQSQRSVRSLLLTKTRNVRNRTVRGTLPGMLDEAEPRKWVLVATPPEKTPPIEEHFPSLFMASVRASTLKLAGYSTTIRLTRKTTSP
jgi:hypothetical protein